MSLLASRSLLATMLWSILVFTLLSIVNIGVAAEPATLPFQDCFSGNNTAQKFNISTVYGQILSNDTVGSYLNLTLLGETGQQVLGSASNSTNLATLFTSTTILTFSAFQNSSYLCSTLRPSSPLPSVNNVTDTYCPLSAGPLGLSTTVPWNSNHELTTLWTRLRAVDPFSNELLCVDVPTTPLSPGRVGSVYGHAAIILYFTVALTISYWLVVGIARICTAWDRRSSARGTGAWSKVQSAGIVLASAISGERLAAFPALMRFCTPSMRDIIFHTQWCAALAMVAVQWPPFIYPLLTQTSWSTLSYNITITRGLANNHWDPVSVTPYNPPSDFAEQLSDPSSSLHVVADAPNYLFMLPANVTSGLQSFAYAVGLRPQDLFGVCITLFLGIMAAVIILSLAIWMLDWLVSTGMGALNGTSTPALGINTTRSPRYSLTGKDVLEGSGSGLPSPEEIRSLNGHFMFRVASKLPKSTRRVWFKMTPDISSFHAYILYGNLVRVLVWFHFPVTIFSSYQMTVGRPEASLPSIILAALSFTVFSVLIPLFIVYRLMTTSTNKLYDETRTLVFLGPLYNHYRHGSQLFASLLFVTNLAFGVTIGCGQKSGTAQAIIILVIEVISALTTSIWLPWGSGAGMGLISFLFCVARIVIAVLLVILTPAISIGSGAGGWVAYGILVILALVYLAFLIMMIVKIVEGLVRFFGDIGFERSRHVVDSGLLGACGMLGCCGGPRQRRRSQRRRYRAREVPRDQASEVSSYVPPNSTFQMRPAPSTPSTHSGPPASVLRPEHALRPYREESDDESGFIMGAWQPFPRAGYTPVADATPLPKTPPAETSGFSRVGGGRAHYDSPYAIASGSTHTFPSIERGSTHTATLGPVFDDDDSPPPTASVANVARQANIDLPPGAMAPSHIRTKSQTVIIEHAVPLRKGQSPLVQSSTNNDVVRMSTVSTQDNEDGDQVIQPKRKYWYNLRKGRRASEGDALARPKNLVPPAASQEGTGGRSFVVIRDKKRPGSAQVSSTPKFESSDPLGAGSSDINRDRPQSFTPFSGEIHGQMDV